MLSPLSTTSVIGKLDGWTGADAGMESAVVANKTIGSKEYMICFVLVVIYLASFCVC